MLDVQFGQASDFGKVRTNNEDAMGSFIPASRHRPARTAIYSRLRTALAAWTWARLPPQRPSRVMTEEFAKAQAGTMLISLLAAPHSARQRRRTRLHPGPEYRGKKMATTLVACALRYDQAIVSHVGDSRCYLVRDAKARQITQDHTLVNEQRKMGLISAEDIADSDARHVLIRSLGPEMFVSPDTTAVTLQPGDVLVLSTDGLHDEMRHETIAEIVSQKKNMDEIARELVARAVEIDGGDNTTAQVIRVRAVEQVGMYRGRPYRLPS